jgi:hypothetical protein
MQKVIISIGNLIVIALLFKYLPPSGYEKGTWGLIFFLITELIMYRIYIIGKTGKGPELRYPLFHALLPFIPLIASIPAIISSLLLISAFRGHLF